MKAKALRFRKAICAALFVLLLNAVGLSNVLAQTQGALNGVFTINDSGDKVRFSQGNLQYQASTSTWRFATQQYDYVGTNNENISTTYSGWIDLFGWGTSGYHNPYDNYNTQYQPYSTSTATINSICNTYGYGPSNNMQDPDLTATSAEYDWGVHNAISNGGNQAGLWRTLTKDEWNYIFKTRTASTIGGTANARFVMSQVNGVNGLILFPDDYTHPSYLPTPLYINNENSSFNVNSFTNDGWTAMENLGCVFLPASGGRCGTSTRIGGNSSYGQTEGSFGLYWSSSYYSAGYAYHLGFKSGEFYYCDNWRIVKFFGNSTSSINNTYGRFGGYSVRLVCEVGPTVYNIGTSVNPVEGGMVSGAGEYDEGTTCTLTATANPGYTFINWTENGTVVTTNTSYIFTVTGDRNLVANFSINSYNISATTNPANVGTITGTGSYNYGATCTLTATPNEGYTFTNWTENGSVVSTSAEFSFAVTGSRNLVANFNLNSYFIAVAANPSNGGTVTGSGTYNHGTTANLTATANNNYVFSNWTENGNVVSTDANYIFTVTGIRSLVANFTSTLVSYTVAATANPTGGGTVSGMGTYEEGATCTLTATANTGYTFTNWTENGYVVSTNASCSFTVTNNRNLVANFTLNTYYIATLANPTVGGSVTGAGNYDYGTTATLTATANNGYSFMNWTENGNVVSTSSNYSFTVTGTRNLVANFSQNTYTVSASANPTAGGTVSGMSTINYGETATLTATANEGYTFASWMENGTVVSTNANYSFEVTGDRNLVANFSPNIYTVSVSANPNNAGSAIGGGTYAYGTTCTITATADEEYTFNNWTENGTEVSTNAIYSFTVSANRTLVANFSYIGIEGQLSGSFSVSDNTQVCFSQGNLQYQASTDTWRFAINQFDFIGESNANISQTYDGWIDLFGWGTSGWDNSNTYFHPWDSNNDDPALYGPSGIYYSLTGEYANADWGVYNSIINGGNQTNQWWTLSYGQWQYLTINRNTSSGIRYAKAQVNGMNGLILLPDNWSASTFDLQNVNTSTSLYSSNVISLSVWTSIFESNGAVFLPATGARVNGTSIVEVGSKGKYWLSSTFGNPANAGLFLFREDDFNTYQGYRSDGNAVRLVRTIPNIVSYSINAISSPSEGGTVSGAGSYIQGSTCTLSAIANEGYTFVNWTKNDTIVSTSPNYSFSVTESGTYVANFQLNSYQVTATANPTAGGSISGEGTYNHFETCTLTASTNTGYAFVNWTKNGQEVSTNAVYNFTVTEAANLVANFQLVNYDIIATANPAEGGTITGTGTYNYGQTCNLCATANDGYTFTNWTKDGEIISAESVYSFTVTESATFVANFEEIQVIYYNISANSNPSTGGSVIGAGTYMGGQTCILTAIANEGYTFVNWTEEGETVSTNANYSFEVTEARNLVANFSLQGPITNHWIPIQTFENTMDGIGIVLIDGVEQHSAALELGIFCGEECRGSFLPEEEDGHWLYYFSMGGVTGDTYTFRLYDHASQQELELTCFNEVPFEINAFIGDWDEPYEFQFSNNVLVTVSVNPEGAGEVTGAGEYPHGTTATLSATANTGFAFRDWSINGETVSTEPTLTLTVEAPILVTANFDYVQEYSLSTGWNWWSSYIELSDIDGLTMLEEGLGESGVMIKTNGSYARRRPNNTWFGSLNSINNETGYKIQTSSNCTVVVRGTLADPADHPIAINASGWTWIGYPVQASQSANAALSGFNPENKDMIKGQNGYARYDANSGTWKPSSFTLTPGKSYLYYSNATEAKSLVWNAGRSTSSNPEHHWTPNQTFENTMDGIGIVIIDGEEQFVGNLELGIFCGDDCRGSVFAEDEGDHWFYYFSMGGVNGETFTFRLFDHATQEELDLTCNNEAVPFEINGFLGDWDAPYEIVFTSNSPQTFTLPITGYGNSAGGYYLIAPPFDDINPAEIEGMTTGDFDLYYFDEGQAEEWRNYEANPFNLESGKGYLYAHKTDVTLSFTGAPYDGNGQVTLARTAGAEFEGWNLVGNPFAQTATIDRDCYVMKADGTEIIASNVRTVNPMQGVFVIAASDNEMMTFVPQSNTDESAIIVLNVSKDRAGILDRAIVRFEGNGTLPKFMLNPGNTKLYIPLEGTDYAVVTSNMDNATQIGFKARTNGSYTLSVDIVNLDVDYLHLIDNMTGADVDLLQTPSYTFEAHTTDYAERFNLVYATVSSVDSETDTFAFINSSGNLSIFGIEGEATVQVIDILGHVLSSETFSGSYEKKINGTPGVYMVRLLNGDDVKVQKIVVR